MITSLRHSRRGNVEYGGRKSRRSRGSVNFAAKNYSLLDWYLADVYSFGSRFYPVAIAKRRRPIGRSRTGKRRSAKRQRRRKNVGKPCRIE